MFGEIARLKRKARKLYRAMNAASDYGCGNGLAEFISPHIALARTEFEATMARLREIDPALREVDSNRVLGRP